MNAVAQTPEAHKQWLAERLRKLSAADPQLRDSFALDQVTTAKRQAGLRLAQVVKIVMEGYASRPALGQRARELVTDPLSGRKTLRLLPRFDSERDRRSGD